MCKTIGQRMKETRQDRDITQETLAKLLKTTKQQISKYEKDQQEMTVSKFKKWCEILNISADYILNIQIR